ncbi:unnamed protein product [Danaus chrysippus]|uniref:(African queen) hypothetical protein n=1 Tax=Danaus chrysippus TaxID=151541 RepID=A0A8J2R330_9NEOP|nr:unnamed protein product [Danaus chrysippus]
MARRVSLQSCESFDLVSDPNIVSLLYGILLADFVCSISSGFLLAFPSVLNPAILSPNSTDIRATTSQASSIAGSQGLAGAAGLVLLPFCMTSIGRRTVHIVINFIMGFGFLILALATNILYLYAGRIIQGVILSGIYVTSIMVAEYSDPIRRGYFITIKKGSVTLGSLICHLMGIYFTWRQCAFFAIFPNLLAIILTLYWPESPSYLAMKGRYKECEISHKWLFGESAEQMKNLENIIAAQRERRSQERNKNRLKKTFSKMFRKDYAIPFVIFTILLTDVVCSISSGFLLAFPSVLNPAILSANSTDIKATTAQASSIAGSQGLAGAVGVILLPFCMTSIGRKSAHIVMNAFMGFGFLTIAVATNILYLYAGRIIQGIIFSGVYVVSIIVAEYSAPHRRGYFITLKMGSVAFGSLICHIMGIYCTWRQCAFFAMFPNIVAIIMTLFWPESPFYLAMKGRYDECKKSYEWLFGDDAEQTKHLKDIISAQMERRSEEKHKNQLKTTITKMFRKDYVIPFLVVNLLTLIIDCSGRSYNCIVYIKGIIKIMYIIPIDEAWDLVTVISLLFGDKMAAFRSDGKHNMKPVPTEYDTSANSIKL